MEGISRIIIGGFKSIAQEQSIEIKPLTILAGANSSGKSSMMQPMLLLKQTLESTFEPDVLLLSGPNVEFSLLEQFLSRTKEGKTIDRFHIGLEIGNEVSVTTYFRSKKPWGLDIEQTIFNGSRFYWGMSQDELLIAWRDNLNLPPIDPYLGLPVNFSLSTARCFLVPVMQFEGGPTVSSGLLNDLKIAEHIVYLYHLPGLRGSPKRDYLVTATGPTFPGTFETYAASIIEQWQNEKDEEKLGKLHRDLARLALTKKVRARRKNSVTIELLVNRFLQGNKEDMVSIADVGLGVSQALPVVVALHTANP